MASCTSIDAARASAPPRSTARLRAGFDAPMRVDEIDPEARASLGPVLYDIFCASYGALDAATVCDEIVFRAGGLLSLLRDEDGAVVAFGTAKVTEVEVAGRVHRVIGGGLYARPGYRVGGIWSPMAMRIALTERLRDPLRPLALVVETMTPASYRRMCLTFRTVYPAAHTPTPPTADALIAATIADRGLARPTDNPHVVCYPDPADHLAPERLMRSRALRDDPSTAFYLAENPGFVDGHILCTVAPLGWTDIAALAARHIGRALSQTFARLTRSPR